MDYTFSPIQLKMVLSQIMSFSVFTFHESFELDSSFDGELIFSTLENVSCMEHQNFSFGKENIKKSGNQKPIKKNLKLNR